MRWFLSLLCVLLGSCLATASFGIPHGLYQTDSELWQKVNSSSREFIRHSTVIWSSPRCTTRDGNKVRCFYVTSNHTIGYTVIVHGRSYGDWNYDVHVVHQPQVVEYGYHGNFVLFINPQHHLVFMGIETDTAFDHKPTVLPYGEYIEAPTCVALEDATELFCVARGMDGTARTLHFKNGVWEAAKSIGQNPNSAVGCVVNPVARLVQCFASSGDRFAFAERWWSLTGEVVTSRWRGFGEHSRGRPCVRRVGALAHPRALGHDNDHLVDHLGHFGGELNSEPDCASADSRTYDCFAYIKTHGLQRIMQYVGVLYIRETSGWVTYDGQFRGNPSCLYLAHDLKYHCYMTTVNHTLMEGVFGVAHHDSTGNNVLKGFHI